MRSVVLLFLLLASLQAHGVTFTVNRGDDPPIATCTINACSLRAAMTAADGSPGPDTIAFNLIASLPGGVAVVTPTSALPIRRRRHHDRRLHPPGVAGRIQPVSSWRSSCSSRRQPVVGGSGPVCRQPQRGARPCDLGFDISQSTSPVPTTCGQSSARIRKRRGVSAARTAGALSTRRTRPLGNRVGGSASPRSNRLPVTTLAVLLADVAAARTSARRNASAAI